MYLILPNQSLLNILTVYWTQTMLMDQSVVDCTHMRELVFDQQAWYGMSLLQMTKG